MERSAVSADWAPRSARKDAGGSKTEAPYGRPMGFVRRIAPPQSQSRRPGAGLSAPLPSLPRPLANGAPLPPKLLPGTLPPTVAAKALDPEAPPAAHVPMAMGAGGSRSASVAEKWHDHGGLVDQENLQPQGQTPREPEGQESIVRAVYRKHARMFFEEVKQEFQNETSSLHRQAMELQEKLAALQHQAAHCSCHKGPDCPSPELRRHGGRDSRASVGGRESRASAVSDADRASELAKCVAKQQEELRNLSLHMRSELAAAKKAALIPLWKERTLQDIAQGQVRAVCADEVNKAFKELQHNSIENNVEFAGEVRSHNDMEFLPVVRQLQEDLNNLRNDLSAQIADLGNRVAATKGNVDLACQAVADVQAQTAKTASLFVGDEAKISAPPADLCDASAQCQSDPEVPPGFVTAVAQHLEFFGARLMSCEGRVNVCEGRVSVLESRLVPLATQTVSEVTDLRHELAQQRSGPQHLSRQFADCEASMHMQASRLRDFEWRILALEENNRKAALSRTPTGRSSPGPLPTITEGQPEAATDIPDANSLQRHVDRGALGRDSVAQEGTPPAGNEARIGVPCAALRSDEVVLRLHCETPDSCNGTCSFSMEAEHFEDEYASRVAQDVCEQAAGIPEMLIPSDDGDDNEAFLRSNNSFSGQTEDAEDDFASRTAEGLCLRAHDWCL